MSCCDTKKEETADDLKQPAAAAAKDSSSVPLSLSSLAHAMCLPRREDNLGVLEGLLSVVHHTLSQVSSHSPAPIAATRWTLTQAYSPSKLKDLPYTYVKTSYLYSGKQTPTIPESKDTVDDWASTCDASVVGRISLYYASSQDNVTDDDDDDMQQAIMTKALVEYRSQPSKCSSQTRKREELSLTSFGNGSVDDNVKLGALSSLYDTSGKYVLKITSVRSKTYKYDVSDGSMACVTVTNEESPDGPPLTRLEFSLVVNADKKYATPKLRPMSFPSSQLEHHFLVWDAPASATALPSRQTLLLERKGIYINGRLMENAELSPALFGFNLDGVPAWHERIQDYNVVKQAYATLWQEIMIDARLVHLNIASILLDRLMNGVDDEEDDEDGDDTNVECLESQLMASTLYDPVGICAKALATRFAQEFGKSAVPCLAHEVEWFQNRMGHKTPVVVPQRVINVLRRGGYFDLQRDTNEVWFSENIRPPKEGDERKAVDEALDMLRAAGCEDSPNIMFVKLNVPDPVKHKYMCRYNDVLVQYHVNEAVWKMEKPAWAIAIFVAQEYPDGNVLLKLMSK